ncbi:hypothetical protein LGN04_17790 [Burkholderia multivorans]|nr:hypothetical protein [Burkholderia multivorans]
MAIVGIRGATPLTDEVELQAQLATLLRLENVGVMLGAGASVTAGGKTMRSLWSDFVDTSPEEAQWLIDNEFIQPEALAAPDERVVPNVEQLNDSLEIALVEWRRQGSDDVPHLERACQIFSVPRP